MKRTERVILTNPCMICDGSKVSRKSLPQFPAMEKTISTGDLPIEQVADIIMPEDRTDV